MAQNDEEYGVLEEDLEDVTVEEQPEPDLYIIVLIAMSAIMILCGILFTLLELVGYRG